MTGYGVVAVTSAAIIAGLFVGQLHPGNGAVIVALFANKGSKSAFAVYNLLKALELRFLADHGLFGQEGCPHSAADFLVFRHGQFFPFKLMMEGRDYGFVVEHRPSKDNLVAQLSVFYHLGEIVLGYRVGQTGRDYSQGHAFLLCRGHRLTHKRSAPRPQINGIGGSKCQVGKLTVVHGNAKHLRQFINKASRSRGAGFIHVIVHDNAVSLDNQLGVLPADLDDISFGVYLGGGSGLCRYLILNQVGPDKAAHQISTRAGYADANYLDLACAIPKQVPEDLPHSFDRPSRSHQVVLSQQSCARFIHYHCLGAGGADIDPEVANALFFYPLTVPAILNGDNFQLGHSK